MTHRYTGYDYVTVEVPRDHEAMHVDARRAFGWSVEGASTTHRPKPTVELRLKRDYALGTDPELAALEAECHAALADVEFLSGLAERRAVAAAGTLGALGCVPLAISVFQWEGGGSAGALLIGLVGLVLWFAGYPTYQSVLRKQRVSTTIKRGRRLIDVHAACGAASSLIAERAA
ncbi:hypothetical protein [Demequina soli]|uniref:hypothetical protein n=1 Tax=Demequina soli TaxID=1638987 RepID=UPI0007833B02|nr:hypothetical protein [Demequina soli]